MDTRADPPPPRRPRRWRGAASTALLTLACLLVPLSIVSVWASSELADTDGYVSTVGPLARDPAVQAAVTEQVTAAVLAAADLDTRAGLAVDALTAQGVPPALAARLGALSGPLGDAVASFVRTRVATFVASPAFARAWDAANRAGHRQLVVLLRGERGGVLSAQDGTVTINLGPVVAAVAAALVDQGFTPAAHLPPTDRSFTLIESAHVEALQRGYRWVTGAGRWSPPITLALLALGTAVAPRRRRAVVGAALGAAATVAVLSVAVGIARPVYLDAVDPATLPRAAAAAVFDILLRDLRTGLRLTLLGAVVIALVAHATGSGARAARASVPAPTGSDPTAYAPAATAR